MKNKIELKRNKNTLKFVRIMQIRQEIRQKKANWTGKFYLKKLE